MRLKTLPKHEPGDQINEIMADMLMNEGVILVPEYYEVTIGFNLNDKHYIRLKSVEDINDKIVAQSTKPRQFPGESVYVIYDRRNGFGWYWRHHTTRVSGNWHPWPDGIKEYILSIRHGEEKDA